MYFLVLSSLLLNKSVSHLPHQKYKRRTNYGALAIATASAIGFVLCAQITAGLLFVIGIGLGITFAFILGADGRIQSLFSYNVNLKAVFQYETLQAYLDNKPTKVNYMDVIL